LSILASLLQLPARHSFITEAASMSLRKILIIIAIAWLVAVTLIHAWLNLHLFDPKHFGVGQKKFRIGFLPVTCHLTCPVTDFINKQMTGESIFDPVRFNGWPELKEAYLSGYTPATFILAPMAMALREQGVPIKIVYHATLIRPAIWRNATASFASWA